MSPFQTQFPLETRKKFWKKFLPAIIPLAVLGVLTGAFAGTLLGIFALQNAGGVGVWAVLLAVLFPVVLLWCYAWYYGAYIRTYVYDANDSFITIKKGVFAPREIHVQYAKIQDVYVDQDLLDRIMGLYDVHLASATVTSGMEAHIDGVNQATAEGLKQFLLTHVQGGAAPMAPAMPQAPGMPDAPAMSQAAAPLAQQGAVQFSEEISNQTYPLAAGWIMNQTITAAGAGFVVSLFIAMYLLAGKNGAPSVDSVVPGGFLTVFLGVWIGYFVLHMIGNLIWNGNYRFSFGPEYIMLHTGILGQSETHLPYRSVQDVSVAQTLTDRLFGMGRVVVESAAQIAIGRRVRTSGKVVLVGMPYARATHLVDMLQPVLLAHTSTQTGL